jgi:hypothetical protein
MKSKSLIIFLILPLMLGYAAVGSIPNPEDTPVALVKKIVKNVTFRKAGQDDWATAKTGLPLNNGEEVKTGANSLALILFTDGSGLLKVQPNSILKVYGELDNKKINKNTFIDKGSVGFDVNKQADEEFKFTTPTAVASIRGTEGLFEVADNGESVMVLKTGSVELQTKSGKKVTLTAGNTAVFDLEGNATVTPSTEDDKKKLSQATSLTTKKVIIKTSTGEEITVEYFSGENK